MVHYHFFTLQDDLFTIRLFSRTLKIIIFPLENTSRAGHDGVKPYHWDGAHLCLLFPAPKRAVLKRTTNSNSSSIFCYYNLSFEVNKLLKNN